MQASVALHVLDRRPEQAEVALGVIRDASKEGLDELRSLVAVLRDEHRRRREPTATLHSLDEVLERTRTAASRRQGRHRGRATAADRRRAGGVPHRPGSHHERPQARRRQSVRVVLDYRDVELDVQVEDDGRGLGWRRHRPGAAWPGMRERAQSLGGTLHVDRSSLGGTRVAAVLPLRGGP